MLLRKRKVTTEQSDNRRICFLCNSIFINPLSKGARRKSFQLAELNIPKYILEWQHKQDPIWKTCRKQRRQGGWGSSGSLARALLWTFLQLTQHTATLSLPNSTKGQGLPGQQVEAGLSWLSFPPSMEWLGLTTSLCLQQTHKCLHRHRDTGFFQGKG